MAERELYDDLAGLLPAQLDEVIAVAGVAHRHLSPSPAPAATRARELVEWAAQTPDNRDAILMALRRLRSRSEAGAAFRLPPGVYPIDDNAAVDPDTCLPYHVLALSDRMPMVLVPAGKFRMGSEDGDPDAEPNEKPARDLYLTAYYIDKYPVTNEAFKRFVELTGYISEVERNGFGYIVEDGQWTQVQGAHWRMPTGQDIELHATCPVVQVTWNDALAYCNWADKRLPSEAEWEKAARGVSGALYPWGNEWDRLRAIHGETSYGTTHPVDRSSNLNISPFGAVDMAGNCMEWTADWYDSDYHKSAASANPRGPESGGTRAIRGGSFLSGHRANLRSSARLYFSPSSSGVQIGFRCVLDP